MARKKRDLTSDNLLYYQRKYLSNKIRQISIYWPYKNKAKNKAKVEVLIGKYKNGNPKYKIKYKCDVCKNLFDEIEMDHINPIVNTEEGFTNWSDYINNALCDESNYSAKCHECHLNKTTLENKKRKKLKKTCKKS